jgi:hypothetical protein
LLPSVSCDISHLTLFKLGQLDLTIIYQDQHHWHEIRLTSGSAGTAEVTFFELLLRGCHGRCLW